MNAKPQTELGDIAPIGAELDESALSILNGGQDPDWGDVMMCYFDPPGWCGMD
ncbi:hypothetical protein [Nonomuraea sp. NPDC001023]|uniref:hypothetical protein n=1 Tax=unclassified Nonomuraea TaxID=2593643 RepID=UPI00332DA6E3